MIKEKRSPTKNNFIIKTPFPQISENIHGHSKIEFFLKLTANKVQLLG